MKRLKYETFVDIHEIKLILRKIDERKILH